MSGSPSSAQDAQHAEPVSLTIYALPEPDIAPRRTVAGRLKMLLILAICAAPVVASYVTYFFVRPQGRTNYGELISPTRALPAGLHLQALDGRAVAPASLRGQWLLVVVGDAGCDAACDKRLFTQRQLREMLGKERDRIDKVWFVTGSGQPPAPLLNAALATPGMSVLRADAGELDAWLAPAPGHRLEEHLYLVDPMGEWMMRMPVDPDPVRVKRDLERLLRASAGWDQPGR